MAKLSISKKDFLHLADAVPTLRSILWDLMETWPTATMKITSTHRTQEEEDLIAKVSGKQPSGIHMAQPLRAIDIGTGHLNRTRRDEIALQCTFVNRRWIYDTDRPNLSVVVFRPHGTGPHVHIQVHQNTIRVDPSVRRGI